MPTTAIGSTSSPSSNDSGAVPTPTEAMAVEEHRRVPLVVMGDASIAESLYVPLASESEAALVCELRKELADDLARAPSAKFEDVSGDIRLLRFLRGWDHSILEAAAAVREMLALRAKYDLDELHETWAHVECDHRTADFPHQEAIDRLKPGITTAGLSHDGHVLVFEPLRHHQYGKVLEAIGDTGMRDHYFAQCESRMGQLQRLSVSQQRMVKMVLVLDWRGVSLWTISCRRWREYDSKYATPINKTLAEGLAKVFVINTPGWAVGFYNQIKWWIPKKTQSKIALLGVNFEPELLKVMSKETMESMLSAFE